jgi:predicted PurR-regulated permease PerM
MEQMTARLTQVTAALLISLALWSMRTVLGPLVATGALFFLLWPYRGQPGVRRLLAVLGLLVTLWILAEARSIVYPALAALAMAFLLHPAVNRLARWGVPRSIGALILILPLLGLMVVFVLVVVPALVGQARSLIEQIPKAYAIVVAWLEPQLNRLMAGQFPLLPRDLSSLLPDPQQILHTLTTGVVHVGKGVAAIIRVATFLILTPILAYYILVDFDRLQDFVRPYVTPVWAARLKVLGAHFQESVGGWLKGQLLVALIIALLSLAGFVLIGLPYALLLSFVAGLLNLIPTVGFWVTALLAVVAALFAESPLAMVLRVAIVLLVIQALEQHVLSPLLVGRRLRVKPVVLLIVMLGMGALLGVIGILLAAPLIGLANGIWALLDLRPPQAAAEAAGSSPAEKNA